MSVYPGDQAPALEVATIDGSTLKISEVASGYDFTLMIFYRGSWCVHCKRYMKDLEEHYEKLTEAKIKVISVSMDGKEKAVEFATAVAATLEPPTESLKTTIAYGLTKEQALEWGLYMTQGRPGTAEPPLHSEPGMFVLKPDNSVYMISKASAPYARPNVEQLMAGLAFVKANGYPARGTFKG